ncbi:MAG: DUF4175 family protein [Cytophagales bacterium]|nr:DUF4175 family protein [Cytophagales bacterium]
MLNNGVNIRMIQDVLTGLANYKRKYYLNKLIKGAILFFAIITFTYLLFTSIEFYSYLSQPLRAFLLFTFVSLFVYLFAIWILIPIYKYISAGNQLTDEQAAAQIGALFPDIKDKLLNTLQLSKINHDQNTLLQASIAQKTKQLSVYKFDSGIKLSENRKYLKYIIPPVLTCALIFAFIPELFTESTSRIMQYHRRFTPPPPFTFNIVNKNLQCLGNEDFEIKIRLEGKSLPEDCYINFQGLKRKMDAVGDNTYTFIFKNITKDIPFYFEASGFLSSTHNLTVFARPSLNFFQVTLDYPKYLGKKNETLSNAGNLIVPEGTRINWNMQADDCKEITVVLTPMSDSVKASKKMNGSFEFNTKAMASFGYAFKLYNHAAANKEKIEYTVSIIPDEYPKLNIDHFKDTSIFRYIVLGGSLSDDYGITKLSLFYKINNNDQYHEIPLQTYNHVQNSNFYYRWEIDTLKIPAGQQLEYYIALYDNDGVHGPKMTKSEIYELKMPTQKEIEQLINESTAGAEKQISATHTQAEQIKNEIKKLEDKLKSKRTFDWQDRKSLEDIINKHENLQKEIEQLKEKHDEMLKKQDRFDKTDERIAEKSKMLQQLMNEILDEETKKMYDELNKLLQEKGKENEMKDLLEKIKDKEESIEKELDRALEMFKQLKLENKMEQISQNLKDLAQKQEQQADKNNDKEAKSEDLKKEQDMLNKEFEDVQNQIQEMEQLNEDLENKNELENTSEEQKNVKEEQQNSSKSLENNDKSKAEKSQKKAADKMKKLQEKMEKMQQKMQDSQVEENMEDLRQILENLITLSYDQEDLMKEFKKVNQLDPRYITLSQKQLKLKDDSKIIEDSLYALSKRVFQIQSFVKKEMEDMKDYMNQSTNAIKARRADMAAGKQQFAMTSMNNLALLLSDVLQQMQDQSMDMKSKQGGGGMPGKKKKQCNSGNPSMSQLQKSLNNKIEQLKKSGMSGRKLSEQLSKMARDQERIRQSLDGDNDGGGKGKSDKPGGEGNGDKSLEQLKKEMEQTEKDLVNKQLTQEMLNRQQDILSRLLEHEKAQRERELKDEREAEQAKDKAQKIPASFEQYLKEKEKQVELLKTIPPSLNPYYKKEVNEYFMSK